MKQQYTLKQVMGTMHTLPEVLEIPPTSIEPNITWDLATGPKSPTDPLSTLSPSERSQLEDCPAFIEAEAYLEDLGDEEIDLAALHQQGWKMRGHCDFDRRFGGLEFTWNGWHMLVAVDGNRLVYWVVVNSVAA
jgi:hypothetical protein